MEFMNVVKNHAMLEGHCETDEDAVRWAAVAAISYWFPVMPTVLLALAKLKDNLIAPCPHWRRSQRCTYMLIPIEITFKDFSPKEAMKFIAYYILILFGLFCEDLPSQ